MDVFGTSENKNTRLSGNPDFLAAAKALFTNEGCTRISEACVLDI
jgi:hypothetical protein